MNRWNKKLVMTTSIIVIVLVGVAGFFAWKYTQLKNSPSVISQATTNRLVEKVGKLYNLPKGEDPTIAEVKDKSKLDGQPFFKDAKDGDYILIYTNAKLALLYRESSNKLINVGPITIQDRQKTEQSDEPATP